MQYAIYNKYSLPKGLLGNLLIFVEYGEIKVFWVP